MKKHTHENGTTITGKHPRSEVDRSHFHITTVDTGELIPILADLIYPGDKINISVKSILRQTTLTVPVMDTTYIDIGVFFVPLWQIWDDFFKFFGENNDPFDVKTKPTIPQLTAPTGGWKVGTIADYLKYPVNAEGVRVSALKARAYAKIINDYYRDQNLQSACHINLTSTATTGSNGTDKVTDIEKGGMPFIAGKYPDYFTTAIPKPQKGDDTTINIAGDLEVHATGTPFNTSGDDNLLFDTTGLEAGKQYTAIIQNTDSTPLLGHLAAKTPGETTGTQLPLKPNNLRAKLSDAAAITINELRDKFTEQQIKEVDAIFGTRYNEYLKGHWGVNTDMSKINKSMFLGGTHEPIDIHQVPQTSATTTGENGTPLATLGALGQTKIEGNKITKAFDQHGYLMVMATVRYNHTYDNGIEIEDLYEKKEDFFDPLLNNIGNQPIYNKEIFFDSTTGNNDKIFGWKEAWQETREKQNRVTGLMRPQVEQSIGILWNYADTYNTVPILSGEWIQEDKKNVERTLAVTNQPQFFAQFYFKYKAERQIALYSIPGLKKL